MSFKIEKNIPVPPKGNKKKKSRKYPLDKMEVGDSFFIKGYTLKKYRNISSTIFLHKKRNPGAVFTVRKMEGGIRVFRIE